MNDESLDKEINELYLKRKEQLDVPSVNLSTAKKTIKETFSLTKILALFSVGLGVSFGIFALVQHIAHLPQSKNNKTIKTSGYIVEREDKIADIPVKVVVPKKIVKLPQAPSYQPPNATPNIKVANLDKLPKVELLPLPKAKLATITVSSLAIKPDFKVMPNINEKITPLIKNGFVQLRYNINKLGETENIKIIKSSVTQDIQRAAKKALRQWRYQPKQQFKDHYEVVFEFKVPNK